LEAANNRHCKESYADTETEQDVSYRIQELRGTCADLMGIQSFQYIDKIMVNLDVEKAYKKKK
jgi:hypothetical protein